MMQRGVLLLVVAAFLFAAGCSEEGPSPATAPSPDRDEGGAIPGPWVIAPATLQAGDPMVIEKTGAGPWTGPEGCAAGLTPGAVSLSQDLLARFSQITEVQGFSCRSVNGAPEIMSVHAVGRALDVFVPLAGGDANNVLGDPIGDWLIEHAEEIGIQYIIWDAWVWNGAAAPGHKSMPYGGAHPHHDHLHVELSVAAGNMQTEWFGAKPSQAPSEVPGPFVDVRERQDGSGDRSRDGR